VPSDDPSLLLITGPVGVGKYQYSVHMGMLLDQLWVR
jgi:hypothetical protein